MGSITLLGIVCFIFFLVILIGSVKGIGDKFAELEAGTTYYEDLPEGFDIDYLYLKRSRVQIGVLVFWGVVLLWKISFTFSDICYAVGVIAGLVLIFYAVKDNNIFSHKSKNVRKHKTAEGLNTLTDTLKSTERAGSSGAPMITYYERDENIMSLCATNEDRGIVIGAPGSGKSTYLIAQIIDWMHSGKSFVATDIKPEIWAALKVNGVFEKFGYKDWVFNPTDVHSHHYNIFSEIKDSSELNEVLAIIIKDDAEQTSVFTDNARRLLKAIILELGDKATLVSAKRYIDSMDDNEELLKSLRQSDNETVSSIAKDITRSAKNGNLLASIMTSFTKAFDFLDDERIRETTSNNSDGFYLKDVLMKPKQAVFLQFDQQYKNTTSTLFGVMVAHTMRLLQTNQNRDEVFIALDEIINCAPIPKFTETLNTIRSAKMPTFLYLQSLEGLNRVYGDNADRLFLGSSNLKIVFKIGDIETAEHFTKLIGQTETTYYSHSSGSSTTNIGPRYGGQSSTSQTNSSSSSTKIENIIEPEEFTQLADHTAVVTYNGGYGTVKMPTYYDFFGMYERTHLRTVGEFKHNS